MKRINIIIFWSTLFFGTSCSSVSQTTIESVGAAFGLEIQKTMQSSNMGEDRILTEEHLREIGYVQ